MTAPVSLRVEPTDLDKLATLQGRVAVLVDSPDTLDQAARRINRLTRGALQRLLASDRFSTLTPGDAISLSWPTSMLAEAVDVVRLPRRADTAQARKAGVVAAAITAAQFLGRFVKDGTPWVHLYIVGVASVKADTICAPKGASGWGVLALNRLVADRFET